jgi:hypothetical protein
VVCADPATATALATTTYTYDALNDLTGTTAGT